MEFGIILKKRGMEQLVSIKMSSYKQFQKFQNLQYLTKDQLKLATDYICEMMDENYEYFYVMYCFAMKCFPVFKKEKAIRCGMTLCHNEVVDFIFDNKHDDCRCTNGLKDKIHLI